MERSERRYITRVMDRELDALMPSLPAIALEGARGVGKTATARQRSQTAYFLDNPDTASIIAGDPELLLRGPAPILIDEWQRFPYSWDLVRRAVDENGSAGTFLLTGSANRLDLPAHSGAGRIVRLHLRPMTISERGVAFPTVSLASLLKGNHPRIEGTTDVSLEAYVREIVASGLPGVRHLTDRGRRDALDSYLAQIVDREFLDQGHRVRNPVSLQRWMAAYAASVSTTAAYETIRDAATGGRGEKPARSTVAPYIDILQALWVLEPIPAWLPSDNRMRRLALSPKHQLFDPAVAARMMNLDEAGLMASGRHLGPLFESLVSLSVRVYAQAAEARVFHLRTREPSVREVDLIVEGHDGGVVGVEVKLAQAATDHDVRHLNWLREQIGPRFRDGIIVTTGSHAYRRQDGIAVVPAALLGP